MIRITASITIEGSEISEEDAATELVEALQGDWMAQMTDNRTHLTIEVIQ
jgi:hypothetical protein